MNGTEYEIEVQYDYTPGRRASGPRGEPPVDPPEPETVEINGIRLILPSPHPASPVYISHLLYPVLGIDDDALREKICEHEADQDHDDPHDGDGKED